MREPEVETGRAGTRSRVPVEVHLLGGFRVTVRTRPLELAMSSQRVIAFLALAEQPVSRSHVAASLWLDRTDERANANLRQSLWRLGRYDVEIVTCNGKQIALGPHVEVDLRWTVERCRRLLDLNCTLGDVDLDVDVDFSRFGRELLPGWFDDWVVIDRERLIQLRQYAMEMLCVRLVDSHRVAEAVDVGLQCVAADPLRESAQRALIRAHIADGNWNHALRQYEQYCVLLAESLRLLPTEAMQQLVAPILERSCNASAVP